MTNYIINGQITVKKFLFFRSTKPHRFTAEGICKTEVLNELRSYILNHLYKNNKVVSIKIVDIYKVR